LSPCLLERALDDITCLAAVAADQAGQADKPTMVLADKGIEARRVESKTGPRDGVPSSVRGQGPRSVLLALNHRDMREAFRVILRRRGDRGVPAEPRAQTMRDDPVASFHLRRMSGGLLRITEQLAAQHAAQPRLVPISRHSPVRRRESMDLR
jgi:hypothetical protein